MVAASSSSSMALPTLPVIGVVPSIVLFQTLEWLALGVLWVILLAAVVSLGVLLRLVVNKNNKSPKQRQPNSCRRYVKTVFLFVGKRLCVYTFPALFKMHKTRSGYGKPTRSFMVFLDRKVENSLILVAAFCSIICNILCLSTKVFLRYFPVEVSAECFEKDSHGQSLFCYLSNSIVNSSLINPNFPVDCANFSLTELRELQFQCYAIAPPTSLGIAVAAALGLAKVAIVGVTIFVKVTEGFFKMTKSPPRKLQEVCCRNRVNRIQAIAIYSIVSAVFLLIVSLTALLSGVIYTTFDTDSPFLHRLYYWAYFFLPLFITPHLVIVIIYLIKTHCDKGEYISIAADQRPLDPRDWDVESETDGEDDEAKTGGESNIVNGEPPCELSVESESEGEDDEASNAGESCIINGEAPDPSEGNVESESEGENDEASNAGESCNTNSEVPDETQEMSVQFNDSNRNTEECASQV